ncbi:MAG: SMC-Scp complex subunit ScpB [Lentisphaeria bacterium]|nr:SMC-Scp complex subunit ScpB [Candidatus Neomarinimicrobiota bacterium]MCF7842703.1 SMC-Scp complex subunit ScpB [Lentisphaeria bacterium]
MDKSELIQITEALLIATPEPLTEARFAQCFDSTPDMSLNEIIESLSAFYKETDRAFQIFKVANGYQLVTRKEFEPFVKRLYTRSARLRLSQAALETLAIITYRQPISRVEIEAIRGVSSDSPLRTLLERRLIEIRGRDEGPGRALLYRTTTEFLQYFGLNSLQDLPKLREAQELIQDEDESLV